MFWGQTDNTPFGIAYGTGQAVGFTDVDTLTFGQPPVTVSRQEFGEMYKVSDIFLNVSCDGLFVGAFTMHD